MDPLPLEVRDPVGARLSEVTRINWVTVNRAVGILERLKEHVPEKRLIRRLAAFARAEARRRRQERLAITKENTMTTPPASPWSPPRRPGEVIEEPPTETARRLVEAEAARRADGLRLPAGTVPFVDRLDQLLAQAAYHTEAQLAHAWTELDRHISTSDVAVRGDLWRALYRREVWRRASRR
jgi:hypothetical protein